MKFPESAYVRGHYNLIVWSINEMKSFSFAGTTSAASGKTSSCRTERRGDGLKLLLASKAEYAKISTRKEDLRKKQREEEVTSEADKNTLREASMKKPFQLSTGSHSSSCMGIGIGGSDSRLINNADTAGVDHPYDTASNVIADKLIVPREEHEEFIQVMSEMLNLALQPHSSATSEEESNEEEYCGMSRPSHRFHAISLSGINNNKIIPMIQQTDRRHHQTYSGASSKRQNPSPAASQSSFLYEQSSNHLDTKSMLTSQDSSNLTRLDVAKSMVLSDKAGSQESKWSAYVKPLVDNPDEKSMGLLLRRGRRKRRPRMTWKTSQAPKYEAKDADDVDDDGDHGASNDSSQPTRASLTQQKKPANAMPPLKMEYHPTTTAKALSRALSFHPVVATGQVDKYIKPADEKKKEEEKREEKEEEKREKEEKEEEKEEKKEKEKEANISIERGDASILDDVLSEKDEEASGSEIERVLQNEERRQEGKPIVYSRRTPSKKALLNTTSHHQIILITADLKQWILETQDFPTCTRQEWLRRQGATKLQSSTK